MAGDSVRVRAPDARAKGKDMIMSSKALIPLIVGCAVGLFAIKMVVDVVQKAQGVQTGNLMPLVVASREIAAYEAIHQDMLRTTQVPKDMMLEGAFSKVEDLEGRVAAINVYKGMTLIESMLTPPGTIPGITAVIPEGYRAVAVKVDEETGGAGFIKPGHRVDVATVMNVKRGNKTETVSRVILQNVEVVAAGQQLTASDGAEANLSRSITLAVKAEDVSKLHLAATRGKIRLAIRNNTDAKSRRLKGTTEGKVLGEEGGVTAEDRPSLSFLSMLFRKPEVKPGSSTLSRALVPVNRTWSVVVVNGDESETICFRDCRSMQRVGSPGGFSVRTGMGTPTGGHGASRSWANTAGGLSGEDSPVEEPGQQPMEETE